MIKFEFQGFNYYSALFASSLFYWATEHDDMPPDGVLLAMVAFGRGELCIRADADDQLAVDLRSMRRQIDEQVKRAL